ncbi:FxDxF family PEP-CTERM protein [Herbaspirillum lusitanum]|jgi:hypothetical protein|uniref:FxDxF family PEP-CTERM protein n=1 Tax=Herbaspirillum lusitanum TaxID=213312 RepID=A0ABW9AGN7_9BURK
MQKFLKGIFLALSLVLIGQVANAAQINGTTAVTFNADTATIGASFGNGTKGKTFLENYTFTYGGVFDLSSAVISIALSNVSALTISSFTLSGNGNTYTGTKSTIGNTVYYTLDADHLSAGSYILAVAGKVTGTRGGSFGGNINVTAVPEASKIAMMLGGLALVGFMSLRRRRAETARVQGNMLAA